jgi:hypothetical protein
MTATNARTLVVDYLCLLSICYFDTFYSVHLDYSFMIPTNEQCNQDTGNKQCQNTRMAVQVQSGSQIYITS